MAITIGIDLGTTNSCAAWLDHGQPHVIFNDREESITPSVVAFTDNGEVIIGEKAKRQAASNPEYTIYAAKRLIGRAWDSDITKRAIGSVSYYCKAGQSGDIRIIIHGKEYSLPEISGFILAHIKKYSEERLGQEVPRAVITVPAYFNDGQRQATKDAGKLANLEVIRIINEPTAAALAAGFGNDDVTIAIYDLGGGTFDVSILDIEKGVFEVLATSGDSFLGGVDFDNRLIEHLAATFKAQEGIDLHGQPKALQRLREAAEKAKMDLSEREETQIFLPFIYKEDDKSLHLQATLTRGQLEELTRDLVQRTLTICDRALEEASMEKAELDHVIMVGGMSRMPLVRAMAKEYFGKELNLSVNPDHAVAIGAAIQAGMIEGEQQGQSVLLDVTSQDLGIQVLGDVLEVLIPRNTTIPTEEKKIFHTVRDDQTEVRIVILQGNNKKASENDLLGEFTMTGLRQGKRGEVRVEVSFRIDADGILSVHARDMDTNQEQSIVVNAHTGFSDEEIAAMKDKAYQANLPASELTDAFEQGRREAEEALYEIDRLLAEARQSQGEHPSGDDPVLSQAVSLVGVVRSAINRRDTAVLEQRLPALKRACAMLSKRVADASPAPEKPPV